MGDYGFKHAGEFGGSSSGENFHCLPDYHFSKCHLIYKFKDSRVRKGFYCRAAYNGIEDDSISAITSCNFCGDDYRLCSQFKKLEEKND
jgi:hypothetical protein